VSSDDGGKRFIPWVCIVLLVANLGAFAYEIARGGDVMNGPNPLLMLDLGGNVGVRTLDGEPWRLFTSMFLHYGIIHLAMNMLLGLFQFGQVAERLYGHASFAVAYVVAGLAGSLASALRGTAISAGASGAVFGIIGAFGAYLIFHRKRFDQDVLKKQLANLAFLIGINVWLAFQVPGIDQAAHIGGLVTGFLVGLALEAGHRPGSSRLARAALVGVLGVGGIVGATFVMAPQGRGPSLELERGADEFFAAEKTIVEQWNGVVRAQVDDAQAARVLADEIIPAWDKAQVAYVHAGGNNARLLRYINMRRDAWQLMLEAVQAGDKAAVGAAQAKHAEALRLLEEGP
jgi:rhomboid protease GluP